MFGTDQFRPLLLKRYPGLTEEQITEAHAHAYGGAVIQDLGYYPFGSREFSDLLHYVRSGDFVRELLIESQDVNEYAFALGALSHYASDIAGHPAVNQSVAIQHPKLRAKYGKSVRYAQDKTAHLKTEFGFDTGAGCQESICVAAMSRFHRIPGVQVFAGASLSGCIRSGVERGAHPRGPGSGFLSLRSQPADSSNDENCGWRLDRSVITSKAAIHDQFKPAILWKASGLFSSPPAAVAACFCTPTAWAAFSTWP